MVSVGVLYFAALAVRGEETTLQKVFHDEVPKYDPTASRAPAPSAKRSGGSRKARTKMPNPESAASSLASAQKEAPVMLPRFMVKPLDAPLATKAAPLPSMMLRQTFHDDPADQFESVSARDARLVRNHLSEFDRTFLNRFTPLGISKEQRAREAEAIRHSAQEMDSIAELIQTTDDGKPDPAEAKKLREAYFDTYMARPK